MPSLGFFPFAIQVNRGKMFKFVERKLKAEAAASEDSLFI